MNPPEKAVFQKLLDKVNLIRRKTASKRRSLPLKIGGINKVLEALDSGIARSRKAAENKRFTEGISVLQDTLKQVIARSEKLQKKPVVGSSFPSEILEQMRKAQEFAKRSKNEAKKLQKRKPLKLETGGLFDAAWYLQEYPDVHAAGLDPLAHYLKLGWKEGRKPSPGFDPLWYLDEYADVRVAGLEPLTHYLKHGVKEGRLTCPPPAVAEVGRTLLRNHLVQNRGRVLWISGESHTPGHQYRVIRYVAAAEALGMDASWMTVEQASKPGPHLEVDFLIVWRACWSGELANVVHTARLKGAMIGFDVDDLMVDPSLAKGDSIDAIRFCGFDPDAVAGFYRKIQETMLHADFCTAPTAELAQQMRFYGKTAAVLPNGIDEVTYQRSRLAARHRRSTSGDGLLRLGYASGTRTHQRDFAQCADAVAWALGQRPDARLVLFRDPATGKELLDLSEFPALAGRLSQVEWRNVVDLEKLPDEIARFDINLAPIEFGNPYCEAKSELKYFESAIAGVCTIASPTGPFKSAIEHGVTGMLAANTEEWKAALTELMESPIRRRSLADAACRHSLWAYGIERRIQILDVLFTQMTDQRAGAWKFAAELALQSSAHPKPEIPESRVEFEIDSLRPVEASVIVPLYNYESYVIEALESVRRQTLADLELIVINDASTDNSLKVATTWAKQHAARFSRILVLSNVKNSGLGLTRNTGYAAATSAYVLSLDADNRLLPQCMERCLEVMRKGRCAFVFPHIQRFGADNGIMGTAPFIPQRLIGGNFIDAMALISVAAWSRCGGYVHVAGSWEDYEFWGRIAEAGLTAESAGTDCLAEYRVHQASMSMTAAQREKVMDHVIAQLRQRHPWFTPAWPQRIVVLEDSPSQKPLTPVKKPNLEALLEILRCPETGARLELNGDSIKVVGHDRRWPLLAGRPVLFPGYENPEVKSDDHVSNQLSDEVLRTIKRESGLVLNLSAGGSMEKPDNVIEVEAAVFRNTDVICDAHRLPFADGVFAGVVAFNAFEHYSNPRKVALEILRILKPGGWLVMRTAFLQPEHEAPWHFYNCTASGLRHWFEGFEGCHISVPDNMSPMHSLAWIASQAEFNLRKETSDSVVEQFTNLTVRDLIAAWRNPEMGSGRVWQALTPLSQESKMQIAAGFELVAMRPGNEG